jgi:hypothetical protein
MKSAVHEMTSDGGTRFARERIMGGAPFQFLGKRAAKQGISPFSTAAAQSGRTAG